MLHVWIRLPFFNLITILGNIINLVFLRVSDLNPPEVRREKRKTFLFRNWRSKQSRPERTKNCDIAGSGSGVFWEKEQSTNSTFRILLLDTF